MPTRRDLLRAAGAGGAALVAAPALALAQDSRPAKTKRAAPLVIYAVRHAEKGAGRDPGLTEEGAARAQALARTLRHVPVEAVYSTATTRTRSTAEPLAKAASTEIRAYEPFPASELAKALVGGDEEVVLVVGHSNTVPSLVAAFGLDPGGKLLEGYEDLFQIVVPPGGAPLLQRLTYGAKSTAKGH